MATELETVQQQLADTRAAISAILTSGQSGSAQGRQLTRADLGELRSMERELLSRVARLTRGGIRTTQIIPL
jgi:hypothetical protein